MRFLVGLGEAEDLAENLAFRGDEFDKRLFVAFDEVTDAVAEQAEGDAELREVGYASFNGGD